MTQGGWFGWDSFAIPFSMYVCMYILLVTQAVPTTN